jgi:hypothetical protein
MSAIVVVNHNGLQSELVPEYVSVSLNGLVSTIKATEITDQHSVIDCLPPYNELFLYLVTVIESDINLSHKQYVLKTTQNSFLIGQVLNCAIKEDLDADQPTLVCSKVLATDLNAFPHTQLSTTQCLELRSALLAHLKSILNDDLVATYILLFLFSRAVSVKDAVLSLNVNLTAIPPAVSRQLSDFIKAVHPLTREIAINIDTLNKTRFLPELNDDFQLGELCLPRNSILLLDEFDMKEGKLDQMGTKNVMALQNLMVHGKVPYTCYDVQVDVPTPCCTLISSHSKSIFSHAADQLVYERSSDASDAVSPTSNLDAFSKYISYVRTIEYNVPSSVSNTIQQDYINTRAGATNDKAVGKTTLLVTEDDLKRALELARCIVVSNGKSELSVEDWKYAIHLEKQRYKRLGLDAWNLDVYEIGNGLGSLSLDMPHAPEQ